jgi:hypothetical protein
MRDFSFAVSAANMAGIEATMIKAAPDDTRVAGNDVPKTALPPAFGDRHRPGYAVVPGLPRNSLISLPTHPSGRRWPKDRASLP